MRRRWDEARVAQWLRNMHAEAYIGLFHGRHKCLTARTFNCANHRLEHNISGENLLDLDQAALKEMGVRKIGDRVRIASQIKQLMQREFRGKRSNNGGVSPVCVVNGYLSLTFTSRTLTLSTTHCTHRPPRVLLVPCR